MNDQHPTGNTGNIGNAGKKHPTIPSIPIIPISKARPAFLWSQDFRKKRSIYRFDNAWAQSLFAATPWLTVILIIAALFLAHGRIAITPGVMFDLPTAPLTEGSQGGGVTVLLFSVSRDTLAGDETLVFFDDERYLIQDESQLTRLAQRLADTAVLERYQEMLLLADKSVPHGDVMQFITLARQSGVKRVTVAQKPE
jgi:biopolymer transport protein ExbD